MNVEPFKEPIQKINNIPTWKVEYIDKIIPKRETPFSIELLDSQKFNEFIKIYKV
ncbi:MAG: hypothetical protein IPL26_17115 [Leptospiraceae bacterium]|nr:hypothetical protein [Leptospiraceae bacterium]